MFPKSRRERGEKAGEKESSRIGNERGKRLRSWRIVRELPLKSIGPFFSLISRTFYMIRKRGITLREALETRLVKRRETVDRKQRRSVASFALDDLHRNGEAYLRFLSRLGNSSENL